MYGHFLGAAACFFKKLHWLTVVFLMPSRKLRTNDGRNSCWTERTAPIHGKLLYFRINLLRMVKNENKTI